MDGKDPFRNINCIWTEMMRCPSGQAPTLLNSHLVEGYVLGPILQRRRPCRSTSCAAVGGVRVKSASRKALSARRSTNIGIHSPY